MIWAWSPGITARLQKILGKTTITDCQNAEAHKKENIPLVASPIMISKVIRRYRRRKSQQWPFDMDAESHIVFSTHLFRMRHWVTRKLRCNNSGTSEALFWQSNTNLRSVSNLQWLRIFESEFHVMNLTLANEMDQRIPFSIALSKVRCGT